MGAIPSMVESEMKILWLVPPALVVGGILAIGIILLVANVHDWIY